MTAMRWCQGAVPMKTKTEIGYEARCCRARAVAARTQDRKRGSAWALVYNVLPCVCGCVAERRQLAERRGTARPGA